MASRGVLRRPVAVLLAALLLLLIAAGIASIHVAMVAADAQSLEKPELLIRELAWLAGLLALALLTGAILTAVWLHYQQRESRASEARAREQALNLVWQKEAALAANQARARLLAQTSHELRTPLHAILGYAQLLEIHPALSLAEVPRGWIGGLTQAAWHLQALLDDMLDARGIEAGGSRLQARPVAVESLLGEVLRMVQLQADKAGVRLASAAFAGPPRHALADPLRLRQILLNLLGNAIKYGRRGGHVRVELEAVPGHLQLRVVDNGIGMDRAQLARLFEPFNRLGREKSSIDGSGIGLALVRQLVLQMQGEIRVESQPGIGTTVHLRLPAPPDELLQPGPAP